MVTIMGNATAAGWADYARQNPGALRSTLAAHLQGNHFPPLPEEFVGPAVAAIESANDGDWDDEIIWPEGLDGRGRLIPQPREARQEELVDGRLVWVTDVATTIRILHLDAWLDVEDNDDEIEAEQARYEADELPGGRVMAEKADWRFALVHVTDQGTTTRPLNLTALIDEVIDENFEEECHEQQR